MKVVAIFLCFIFFACAAKAQDSISYDSSFRDTRSYNVSALDSFKAQRDFQYENETIKTTSLWQRFWRWFWKKYYEIMSTNSGRTTMRIIYVLLGISAVSFFIYRVMRMNKAALFSAEVVNKNSYRIEDENIHDISFESAINEAVANGNYRLAIRLLYLENLKLLSDRELIEWLPAKTNAQYRQELKNSSLAEAFTSITSIFEKVWYGHKPISREDYESLGPAFSNFKSHIS